MTNMTAPAVWECPKCKCPKPYNPEYENTGLCSNCQAVYYADKLLGGYRQKVRR